jgi:uncharacterized membrane protein
MRFELTRAKEIAAVSLITLLGAALRAYQIGAQSMWLDELFSVAVARRDWTGVVTATVLGDTNPPLFNLLLHVALRFGSDEAAARAVSCLFSIATIPLMYAAARRLLDPHASLLSTLAVAMSPLHILFAQEARMYAQLAFFALGAMFFFLRAWRSGHWSNWTRFALMGALAFYTHSLAFLNLLALDVYALTQCDLLRVRWRALLASHLFLLVLFAPWLGVLAQQAARVQSGFWGSTPSPLVLFATLHLFLFGNTLPEFLVPIALFVAIALAAFALFAAVQHVVARRADASSTLFALVAVAVPMLALFMVSLIRPLYVERTLLPASIGLYLLLGWAVARAEPRALNVFLGILVILGMAISLWHYYFDPTMHKPPMREAARALAAQFQADDVIFHTSDSSALAFKYYAPDLPNHFLAGDPDYARETTRGRSGRIAGLVPEDADSIIAGHRRLWLVVTLDHNVEYQRARRAEFDLRFDRAGTQTIGGIELILFRQEVSAR